ncbi:MAG: hypothetical protein EXQ88_06335 [Alphaproteobacteria bacterium]|nr:hypothetical protein [Alphaproteobacteria bacterium]
MRAAEAAQADVSAHDEPARDAPARSAPANQMLTAKPATMVSLDAPTRARLTYDRNLSRTVIEVLNPRTGDVLFRFPPEAIHEHMLDLAHSAPGGIVNHLA